MRRHILFNYFFVLVFKTLQYLRDGIMRIEYVFKSAARAFLEEAVLGVAHGIENDLGVTLVMEDLICHVFDDIVLRPVLIERFVQRGQNGSGRFGILGVCGNTGSKSESLMI